MRTQKSRLLNIQINNSHKRSQILYSKNLDKIFITWDQLGTFIDYIEFSLKTNFKSLLENFLDIKICPIIRGGLVPGTLLSHRLNYPSIHPITIQTRDQVNFENLINFPEYVSDKLYIIVEDVVDTGKTLNILNNYFLLKENVIFVSLIKRKGFDIPFKHHISVLEMNFSWIIFPWE